MARHKALLSAVLLLSALASMAESSGNVLRILNFTGSGLESNDAAALQSLVTSYVLEFNSFRVTDAGGQILASKEGGTAGPSAAPNGKPGGTAAIDADFILSGQSQSSGPLIVFSLTVTKVSSGEKRSVGGSFSSVNDLILASRRLTYSLFDKTDQGSSSPGGAASETNLQSSKNPQPSLGSLAGTWRGDKGIDRVTLFRDGWGFAILDSGYRMALKAVIEGSAIQISQSGPNSPDLYRPSLSPEAAAEVSKSARPWRWIFTLSPEGSVLLGIKESVFVSVSAEGKVSLDNAYVRPARWDRISP